MDRVHARNTLIVLLTVVTLTVATYAVMLWRILHGDNVPEMLLGQTTLLTGLLTGSALQLGAQPKVPDTTTAAPATVVTQSLSQGPGVAIVSDPADTADLTADVPDAPPPPVEPAVPGFDENAGLEYSPDNGPDSVPTTIDPQPDPPKGQF
jgi:hypothetical protein